LFENQAGVAQTIYTKSFKKRLNRLMLILCGKDEFFGFIVDILYKFLTNKQKSLYLSAGCRDLAVPYQYHAYCNHA
jgi:hypothetical protein